MSHPMQPLIKQLQASIIQAFEAEEPAGARFTLTPWEKPEGSPMQGGGTMAIMKGQTFEKVGVNISIVHGTFSEVFRKEIPGALESNGAFTACGISLVAHPANPFTPAVHMNLRRIQTSKAWFGGGMDLTPALPFEEDTAHFHHTLQTACQAHSPESYPKYKQWCDEYFFLPHRNEARGIGGIFFDYLEPTAELPEAHNFAFVQSLGPAFLQAYLPLVQKRKNTPFTEEHRNIQLIKRGRYAEFNLLYDRGTRFGLQTGGNTEAILMSLPPEARWP